MLYAGQEQGDYEPGGEAEGRGGGGGGPAGVRVRGRERAGRRRQGQGRGPGAKEQGPEEKTGPDKEESRTNVPK